MYLVFDFECFHLFPVDDGTGVINCLCWKNDLLKEEEDPGKCEFQIATHEFTKGKSSVH